jgi:hypothetical protein
MSRPKSTEANIHADLSKPNIESLVNAPGTSQIIPTTILKADRVGFTKGRSIGLTSNWLAYAMTKGMSVVIPRGHVAQRPGRVRLIDLVTGARLVLSTPYAGQGTVLDIAATLDRIAVLFPDRSIAVFRTPTRWEDDNPDTELMLSVRASENNADGVGEVNRLEWVKKDGEYHLAIGGDQGVVIVKLSAYRDERDLTLAHLEKGRVLKTEGVSTA